MPSAKFGMIGLGTMGRNFMLNVAEQGFSSVGYDLNAEKLGLLLDEGRGLDITAARNIDEFLAALERPRNIMLLVPAGPVVDSVIGELTPLLEPGDLIIDGGNSHFPDTARRETFLNEQGFEFLGIGVSGGEEGARHGASIMAGGRPEIYERVQPILEAASAKVDGEPCAAHVGNGAAGHYVKMVHNGIEYGLMQLIAEAYDLLKRGYHMPNGDMAELFAEWNRGDLNSFLIEITSQILRKEDPKTGEPLVEMILDKAGQKGTGRWTSQDAMDLGIPVPTIDAAVSMRQLSALKPEREVAAQKLQISGELDVTEDLRESTIEFVRDGLHLAFITAYAQGFTMLRAASTELAFELDMVEIAKIWRGGCIIRAALLEDIRRAYRRDPALPNLLVADEFITVIKRNHALLKAFVHFAVSTDIPCMCTAASLNYLKAYASERLPANMLQAQRDYFGAHTYERTDDAGTFHTPDWDMASEQ